MEELSFSLRRKQVRLLLEDEDGQEQVWWLKELTGQGRDEYVALLGSKMSYQNGKPVGLKSFDGLQTKLLELCLYDVNLKPIKKSVLHGWPAAIQGEMFKKAQEISGLGEDDAVESGND